MPITPISVLMPAYNAEKYITQAIESILRQTAKNFELIILDDASGDNTWKIVQDYAAKDSRIKPFQNEQNLNIARSRNKLLALANGTAIAWQDADDISMPDRLEKQYQFLQDHPAVGMVGGFLSFFDDSGKTHGMRKYAATDAELRKNIFKFSPVAQPAAMIKKECFNAAGSFDLSLPVAEDLDMAFRIGQKYHFANLQEVVIQYREHGTSSTYSKLPQLELNTLKIRKKYKRSPQYTYTYTDALYNFFHFCSLYLFPAKFKIALFNFLRNS